MRRRFLMILLGLGALAGFGHGFTHLRHRHDDCGSSCREERDRRQDEDDERGCGRWKQHHSEDEASGEQSQAPAPSAPTALSQN